MQQIVLAEEHLDTTPGSGARVSIPQSSLSKNVSSLFQAQPRVTKGGNEKGWGGEEGGEEGGEDEGDRRRGEREGEAEAWDCEEDRRRLGGRGWGGAREEKSSRFEDLFFQI